MCEAPFTHLSLTTRIHRAARQNLNKKTNIKKNADISL